MRMHESKFVKVPPLFYTVKILRNLLLYNGRKGLHSCDGCSLYDYVVLNVEHFLSIKKNHAGNSHKTHTEKKREKTISTRQTCSEITTKIGNKFMSKSGIFCALNIVILCNTVPFLIVLSSFFSFFFSLL